jgi:hypothetical protein
VRRKLSLLAARMVTGPVAFLLAFVLDVLAYGLRALTRRMRAP